MKLNRLLGQIMSAPNFDHFSAVELRAAYITMHPDKNLIPSDARRFVYAELVKLVNNGWLRKTVSKKKEITTFIKTSLFNVDEITYSSPEVCNDDSQTNSSDKPIQESLRERLNQYKNELLISYGESNEYKKLCDDFPVLYELLQPKYNNAREQNSRLLGQIKAVEKLINESDK
tara:strand:- start:5924 stop:6445 length:522 start_codon:yes stop_codon:yes gene_type:complete